MPHIPLPMAVCAAATEVLTGSHEARELLFEISGIPGPPPEAAHHTKWKSWLFREANKPEADSLRMLGNLIGEFMDVPPVNNAETWRSRRENLIGVFDSYGLRYFRGGRVLPTGQLPAEIMPVDSVEKPSKVEEVLERLVAGLITAMFPLTNRRKGVPALSFDLESDLQDLLHALMRPWIRDIRAEEYAPSYAGKNSRIDFVLPKHRMAIELKCVRDVAHGKVIGNELIIDFDHYRKHPDCDRLWCVILDPKFHLPNPRGLISDLAGTRSTPHGKLDVRVFVMPNS